MTFAFLLNNLVGFIRLRTHHGYIDITYLSIFRFRDQYYDKRSDFHVTFPFKPRAIFCKQLTSKLSKSIKLTLENECRFSKGNKITDFNKQLINLM